MDRQWRTRLRVASRNVAGSLELGHCPGGRSALKGDEPAVTIEKIGKLFNAELANPTDEPTGHF